MSVQPMKGVRVLEVAQYTDNRWIVLHLNQMWRYWPEFSGRLGRPDLLADARYSTADKVREDAVLVAHIVADEIAQLKDLDFEDEDIAKVMSNGADA